MPVRENVEAEVPATTVRVRHIAGLANELALQRSDPKISVIHLMIGIIRSAGGLAYLALANLTAVDVLESRLMQILSTPSPGSSTKPLKTVLSTAGVLAAQSGDDTISSDHLLLALATDDHVARILSALRITATEIEFTVRRVVTEDFTSRADAIRKTEGWSDG